MTDIQKEANKKIAQITQRISRILIDKIKTLNTKYNNDRSITQQQSDLLAQLSTHQSTYKILYSLLNSEIMINQIIEAQDKSEKVILNCYQNMTHLLQNFSLMAKVLQEHDRTLLSRAFAYSTEHLSTMLNQLHNYPISTKYISKKKSFIDQHLNILQEAKQERTQKEQSESNFVDIEQKLLQLQQQNDGLTESNQILRDSLTNAENQMAQLQLKLVNFLNEREQQKDQNGENELKQQIIKLRMQIDRMNEEFRIQINKYNEVFKSMQNEINDLRMNSSLDLVQQLQTQIIRLREQIDSDNIIIQQYRDRQMRDTKYGNPRASNANNSRFRGYN